MSVAVCTAANPPAIIASNAQSQPTISQQGIVVAQDAIAAKVGANILAQGGNAVDAAVATGFALAVTLPQAGNIGGGGFMMVYLADTDKTVAIDYRETAPATAYRDLFLNPNGEVDNSIARFSHRSAGVPGTVAGMVLALENYGSMSLKQVIQPAIELASKGFIVDYPLTVSLQNRSERLAQHPASAKYFFNPDGSTLKAGDKWQQKDLAKSLKLIAKYGKDGFYSGTTADKIVAEMKTGNGLITHQDLASYQAIEREAVRGSYNGYEIASMPPPSSGGVHLIQMLNILEAWDLPALGHNSAAYVHRLSETMRRAYADRSEHLGDPDHVPVPTQELVSKDYASYLRNSISLTKATASANFGSGLTDFKESTQTTHYSVWDKQGNVVSNTYTLNFSYGSGISVSGAGFLLNNEMDDFSAKPGSPNGYGLLGNEKNAIAGTKRPLSSMTPTIVFKEGQPILATGSPGGSTIITTVLQTVLNHLTFDMNIAQATAQPKFHHQWYPDVISLEPGFNKDTTEILKTMGHKLSQRNRVWGKSQSISASDNLLFGANDTRWSGGGAISAESVK
jgi:gamma-glutamyltranspeptidase/glutathione hydrolase